MQPELGQPIANGRTAEVYPWRDGQVLKLFYEGTGLEEVQNEQRSVQAVQTCELPVPHVGDIVHIRGRYGLLYQRLTGVSMLAMMSRRPWYIYRYAQQMAELHAAMHSSTVSVDMMSQQQRLSRKISQTQALSPDQRDKALAALAMMPTGNQLCHGDFHPDNILLTAQGTMIIDWLDASLGNPLADLARTSIILRGAAATSQIPKLWQKTAVFLFHNHYLHHYFSLRPGGEAEYTRWLPLVAAARLSEGIPELEKWLAAQVKS